MRIEAKIAGRRRELFAPVELEWFVAKELTLGELLDAVIRAEVRAFADRKRRQRLDRVLTAAEISAGADRGKVDPAGRDADVTVDESDAVDTALEAFGDGLFFVFVDGRQVETLEATLRVVPTSTLLFVRLTPLAGG